MDSLYGGKPGVSFILSARFDSVADMVKAFQEGPNYKDVWYGQYCIIDTPNKNDKTNGQIYQRGLDHYAKDADGNPTGGAIYIGQIVGPESGTPLFQLGTIPEVEVHIDEPLGIYDYRCYPTEYKYDDEGNIIGYETSDGSDGAPLGQFAFSDAHHTSLVPGKYENELGTAEYRDEIKYTWCNIRKNADDEESWFYVGFEIPYLVTDYSIHMVTPYDENGDILEDATEIERIDDGMHPFYSHWDLGLPKGVKGDTLRNLRVIIPTEEDKIYDIAALSINEEDNSATVDTSEEYAGKDDDVAAGRQIIVFDYCVYDKKQNPEPYTFYLGDFNIITDVKLDDDGTLTITYTHEDNTEFIQRIRWIDQIELTEGNGNRGGHFTFTFNVDVDPDADEPQKLTKEFDVSWIKGLEIERDGSLLYTYAGTPDKLPEDAVRIEEGRYRVQDFMQWLNTISLDPETGVFTITNNRNEEIFKTTLDWIKNIVLDDDGTLHFLHTKDAVDDVYEKYLKHIKSLTLNEETGLFTVEYNTDPADTYTSQLDWIKNIVLDDDGTLHFLHIKDNTDDVYDKYVKHITNVTLNEETGLLTVEFNTGPEDTYTAQLDWIKDIILDEDGTLHFVHTKGSTDSVYGGYLKYITNVSLGQDGLFTIEFNTGPEDTYTSQLDWMDYLYIDEETGEIAIHHADESKNVDPAVAGKRPAAEVVPAKLKLIVRAELTEDGSITFFTNTGEAISMMNADSDTEYKLKTIDYVTLLEGIKDDKHILVKYNTEEEPVPIGDSLNYIKDMVVRTEDWHLLVLYGDPAHRFVPPEELEDLPDVYEDLRKNIWVNNITGSNGRKYDPDVYWQDMGTIKDQGGVLIGFNMNQQTLNDENWTGTVLEYLDSKFPNGLTGNNNEPGGTSVKEKIITFGDNENDKNFYAYDYNKKRWYYLGRLADDGMRDAMLTVNNNIRNITSDAANLHTRGVLFIRNNYTPVDNIPQYWNRNYTDWS